VEQTQKLGWEVNKEAKWKKKERIEIRYERKTKRIHYE